MRVNQIKIPVIYLILDEWRYWKRSNLALVVFVIGITLTSVTVVVNTLNIQHVTHDREHLQHLAETQFTQQPNRHPHRMVHYGHYAFRTPTLLSVVDPGIDAYTGNTIFLEGHRQNSAMFSDQRQSADLGRFSHLTPSFLLQIIVPVCIILMGYAGITRERQSGTLSVMISQGLPFRTVVLGKLLALISAGCLFLLPLIIISIWVSIGGEKSCITVSFLFAYLLYTIVWSLLVITVSAILTNNSSSFLVLLSTWITLCLLIPRISTSAASLLSPTQSKLETDLHVRKALSKLGDGHNAADPAFNQLKSNLLAQYNVQRIEDLPINFQGVIAQRSEKQLTDVLNQFSEQRMTQELAQARIARQFGWLSPLVAIRSVSMQIAGSSLETHHRFLRETEILRFDFVQSLNQLHAESLDYNLDINRNKNSKIQQQARVNSSNWKDVISSFSFIPDTPEQRLKQSLMYFMQLFFWCLLPVLGMTYAIRREQL